MAEIPHENDSDPLVIRAAEGDADALEELLGLEGDGVRDRLRIAPKWSRAVDPDDVLQVTFMEAFLRVGSLRGRTRAEFRAWLRRIAENNLRGAIRGLERDKRPESRGRLTSGPEGESSRTLLARLAEDEPSIGTRVGEGELVGALMTAVDELPASYRQVVRALDLEERSVTDLAEEMGRSHGAVHMVHARALDRLREIMGRHA